jgi:hypothetical protein
VSLTTQASPCACISRQRAAEASRCDGAAPIAARASRLLRFPATPSEQLDAIGELQCPRALGERRAFGPPARDPQPPAGALARDARERIDQQVEVLHRLEAPEREDGVLARPRVGKRSGVDPRWYDVDRSRARTGVARVRRCPLRRHDHHVGAAQADPRPALRIRSRAVRGDGDQRRTLPLAPGPQPAQPRDHFAVWHRRVEVHDVRLDAAHERNEVDELRRLDASLAPRVDGDARERARIAIGCRPRGMDLVAAFGECARTARDHVADPAVPHELGRDPEDAERTRLAHRAASRRAAKKRPRFGLRACGTTSTA